MTTVNTRRADRVNACIGRPQSDTERHSRAEAWRGPCLKSAMHFTLVDLFQHGPRGALRSRNSQRDSGATPKSTDRVRAMECALTGGALWRRPLTRGLPPGKIRSSACLPSRRTAFGKHQVWWPFRFQRTDWKRVFTLEKLPRDEVRHAPGSLVGDTGISLQVFYRQIKVRGREQVNN